MKIEEDGTAVFKSEPYYFKQERDGLKPNTIRLLTHAEKQQIRPNRGARALSRIYKIRIECTTDTNNEYFEPSQNFAPFTRTLTSTEQIGELCGFYLFVFSWRHETEGVEDK